MYVPYEDKIYDDKLNKCKCGGTVTLSIKEKKAATSGMDQMFEDWEIHCLKCGGFWYFPADDFCGRKYYTKEEVVKTWDERNETVTEFADRCRECGKMKRCKDCRFFEYDSWANVDGIPLIVAHEICSKWGEGCKTNENGYCFLFEPKEGDDPYERKTES